MYDSLTSMILVDLSPINAVIALHHLYMSEKNGQ